MYNNSKINQKKAIYLPQIQQQMQDERQTHANSAGLSHMVPCHWYYLGHCCKIEQR